MRKIALVLEYEGTAYAGFQRQANGPSVQARVEQAIQSLTGQMAILKAAGRTDAGVHALGQVAAFETESGLAMEQVRSGLNHYLPDDIAVRAAYGAPEGFDPRRQAVSRIYRYTFLCRDSRSPLRRRFTHQVSRPVDVASMSKALAYLEGMRDFAPFAGSMDESKSTVRRMFRTAVWREADEVHLEVDGNAFLYQQVRRMAGTALQVGLGKMTVEAFGALADSGRRGAAEWVLPPHGLCLRQVTYKGFPKGSNEGQPDHNAYSAS